ncbi:DMP19 family protein [Deinococcus multiflagellatus]|uniref:DMP19 family protein n=1 Tax=Deinococcus multiflagellatus TaxID=1656887 RepID=UPI001CCB55DC|nr:DUF4375 domain-containing protein [Deinococcus multiflagellatus]MBZ9715912.1 DMP19 family protein [Deinococcus multiflagellatus]
MTITDCPPHEPYEALLDRLLHQLPPTRAAYPAFLDSLSQRDRHLLVLQGLHSQVCNGGFAQWISNRYAVQDGPTVLLALDRMRQQGEPDAAALAVQVDALVRQASQIAGQAEDGDVPDNSLGDLDQLDDRYSALSDEFGLAVQGYLLAWT